MGDSATAVATTEDSAMATAVVTDTTVESKKSKDQHNAGAQLYPELASVSALSYLTAGCYFGNKKNQNLNKYAVPAKKKKKKKKKKIPKKKKKKKKKKKS